MLIIIAIILLLIFYAIAPDLFGVIARLIGVLIGAAIALGIVAGIGLLIFG